MVYLSLGATDTARQAAYRHLFRYHLDEEMVSELRLAVNPNQPLGNERFYETIERIAGERREARPRGRPRLSGNVTNEDVKGQGDLGLWGKYRAWPSLASLAPLNPQRKMPRYGAWFLSRFAANVLAGYLAGMLEAVERGAVFHSLGGQADFFLILVVISLATGVLLLAIAGRLCRLMHGRG